MGFSATYPDFMKGKYTRKKVMDALERGLSGRPFEPRETLLKAIWEDTLETARDIATRDTLEYGKLVEEDPETIAEIEEQDYVQLLEVLNAEGYSTRQIEEAAARFRAPIHSRAIESVASELGITEEEINAILNDPAQPIDIDDVWSEATSQDYTEFEKAQEGFYRDREEERRLARREREEGQEGPPEEPRGALPEPRGGREEAEPSGVLEEEEGVQVEEEKEPPAQTSLLTGLIDQAAEEADTEPTPAQIEAGNYEKGHVNIQGLDISIENPKGSVRRGVDRQGHPWETVMQNHYGYIRRTKDRDGDQVDVFLGSDPESERVFVVNQLTPATKRFDEHKAMVGFNNRDEATAAYRANYEPGWRGMGNVVEFSMDGFKNWLKNADQSKPAQTGVGTEGHPLKFMTEHKTREQLDQIYQGFLKQFEVRTIPGAEEKLKEAKEAYEEEKKKYPEKPKRKKKVTEKVEATVEETGEKITMERDAMEAWQTTGAKIESYNQLLECMG
jgi:hypothetical protein